MNSVLIPADEYRRLLVASGILNNMKSEMLPELALALACLIIVGIGIIAIAYLLNHESAENKRLHDVINEMHRQDTERFKDAVKSAADKVEIRAHGEGME